VSVPPHRLGRVTLVQAIAAVVGALAAVVAVYFAWQGARASLRAAEAAGETVALAREAQRVDERSQQRVLLEEALGRVREVMELEGRLAPLDPATFQFEYVDDASALSDLQKALVTFRAFARSLPLEVLPQTEQLTKEGVRRPEDAARLHNQFLNVVDELGDALRALRSSPASNR
jgi:hypothetical protein